MPLKRQLEPLMIACSVACLEALAACGSSGGEPSQPLGDTSNPCRPYEPCVCDRIGDPAFTGPGYAVIGPAGGVVEVTDPSSPAAGVKLEVPPGTWRDCWEVRLRYATSADLMSPYMQTHPAGFEPVLGRDPLGLVHVEIGVSFPGWFDEPVEDLPIEMSFPLKDVQPSTLDVHSAFLFNSNADTWNIVLPGRLSPDRMTVAASWFVTRDLWSWGVVDTGAVDFDRYMQPAMEASHGSATRASIDAALAQLLTDARETSVTLNCAGLQIAEGIFAGARDSAAARIDVIQRSFNCGACNPLTEKFKEELHTYLQVQLTFDALYSSVTTFVGAVSGSEVVEMGLEFVDIVGNVSELSLQKGVEHLLFGESLGEMWSCNYDCYFDRELLPLHVSVALYYGYDFMNQAIRLYRIGYANCPP